MAEEKRNDFINESVKDELIAKAEHWLNKGIALEDEGKSATMVNKCLEKDRSVTRTWQQKSYYKAWVEETWECKGPH